MAEKWENRPKNESKMAIFHFSAIFPPFSRWGQNPFFAHFFRHFGVVQGNRDCQPRRSHSRWAQAIGAQKSSSSSRGQANRRHLLCKAPKIHNSACSQFWECLFAIVAQCSQFCLRSFVIEIQEEIHHSAGSEGGVEGHQSCEFFWGEQIGVSYLKT